MPNPTIAVTRGSYELARTEEPEDDELTLSCDELSLHDPLDEKSGADVDINSIPPTPSTPWATVAQRMRRWNSQAGPMDENSTEHAIEEGREDASLLNTGRSARVQPKESTTVSWLVWPLPSWSHRFFGYSMPEEPHRPTDYLDGLRGVASLFVFFDHYLLAGMADIVNYSYGAENHWNFLQLPFVRTIFSGAAMVSIFFVISGYVLSARFILAIRSRRQDKAHQVVTSMTFRRPMRLFLPSIAGSSLSLIATFMGIRPTHWPRNWTVLHELRHYGLYLNRELFRLWNWEEELDRLFRVSWYGWYAGQLWTIPREFNCSMILFLIMLGTARCTVFVRFLIEGALLAYFFFEGRWDVACFVAGMAIAELNIIFDERRKAQEARAEISSAGVAKEAAVKRRWWAGWLPQLPLWAALFFGWYLTGMPYLGHEHTPGYAFLTEYWKTNSTFKYRFWLAIAGILLTGSLSFLPTAQRLFTTSIARYLGKISYALYLIHSFMNSTLRKVIWAAFGVMEGVGPHNNSLSWTWALATLFYLPCLFWAADVFWRLIDAPAVRFAKWLEKKCFVADD